MNIWTILGGWASARHRTEQVIGEEADALIDLWGDTAGDVAANLSWREDAGLMRSPSPGYWARVHAEVGRRLIPYATTSSKAVVFDPESHPLASLRSRFHGSAHATANRTSMVA